MREELTGEPLAKHSKSFLLPLCKLPEKARFSVKSEGEECDADTGVRAREQ